MASVKEFSVEEKLSSLVRLQKIDSKLDEIQILKGELPMEVKDLEDEIEGDLLFAMCDLAEMSLRLKHGAIELELEVGWVAFELEAVLADRPDDDRGNRHRRAKLANDVPFLIADRGLDFPAGCDVQRRELHG